MTEFLILSGVSVFGLLIWRAGYSVGYLAGIKEASDVVDDNG